MADRLIGDLLAGAKRPLLSFEFFPPKDHTGFAALENAVQELRPLRPDFVTVTYGAGGSTRQRTFTVCGLLAEVGFDPVMPHLTCVGAGRAELHEIIDDIHRRGFRNIMALRGDPPQGETEFRPAADGLAHASELIALVRGRYPDICCGCAGYPEKHPEAATPDDDIRHLKQKLDAGASFVTTQLFMNNDLYYDFVARCRAAGITQPVIPGLMAALSLKQAERMMNLSGGSFPAELTRKLEKAGGTGPEAEEAGIHWLVGQIDDLVDHGVPGIHLYILNRSRTALAPALQDCLGRWRNIQNTGSTPRMGL